MKRGVFSSGAAAQATAMLRPPRSIAHAAQVMVTPVSCFIIAKNEEDRILYALDSVRGWTSEIIVIVDEASDDQTERLARLHGARVERRAWEGYGPQKRYGESLCSYPWILNIDADEAISPALQEEICLTFADHAMDPPADGFRLDIRTVRPGEDRLRPFAPSNSPVRLYRKSSGGFKNSPVHDSVAFGVEKPCILMFKAPVLHRCFRSYRHAVEKINYYSELQAEELVKTGRIPGGLRVWAEPFFAFFKAYVMRRYVFLGTDGFIESVIYAFARVLRLAKARERARELRKEKQSPPGR